MDVQTNPKFWGNDAMEFKPERFSSDNLKDIHPFSYFPFSKGQRSCPGSRYALKSMKIFLSRFLMKYKVGTKLRFEDLKIELQMTMKIRQGFMLNIEKREH